MTAFDAATLTAALIIVGAHIWLAYDCWRFLRSLPRLPKPLRVGETHFDRILVQMKLPAEHPSWR